MSMLQRFVEAFEHWQLIEAAAKHPNSAVRMAYITAFMFSYFPTITARLKKPFNPLLGETFEYQEEAAGFHLIGEQVSHHPPISALQVNGPSFTAYGDTNLKSSFTRSGLEIVPLSPIHIEFKKTGDHFVIHKYKSKVKNVLWGTMYVCNCGEMSIKNLKTNEVSITKLPEVAPGDKKFTEVLSTVKDASGNVKVNVTGDWNGAISYQVPGTGESKEIWRAQPLLPDSPKMYCFGDFALQMNYLNEEIALKACPTDSRFRPDQRALEFGTLSVATTEKNRLEEKQRKKRKELEGRGGHHVPRWFKESTNPETGLPQYEYKGGYWEMRKTGKWTDIDDIY